MSEDASVTNSTERRRYEIHVDGRLAGFAAYSQATDSTVFTHTEIEPAFENRGLGSRLARAALDDVRQRGSTVVPLCPFIAEYIRRHEEYQDLVAPGA